MRFPRFASLFAIVLGLTVAPPAEAQRGRTPTAAVTRARTPRAMRPRTLRVDEGRNTNYIHQSSRVSAHVLVRRGNSPRILVASPSGNAGVGIWFRATRGRSVDVELDGDPIEVSSDGLHGVELSARGPRRLEVDRVVLDSVRALRDYEHGAIEHREAVVRDALAAIEDMPGRDVAALRERLEGWLRPAVSLENGAVVLERTSLAGVRSRLELRPTRGTVARIVGGRVTLASRTGVQFTVRTLSSRPPLTPLRRVVQGRGRMARNLGLLSYEEAFLAGSWQYLTYFGRDTLITATLLGERATPEAVSAAIGSVLDRVSPSGEVAHEESIGEQAALERLTGFVAEVRAGRTQVTAETLAALERPVYDYKMIDGEYLLPPLLAQYAERAPNGALARTLTPSRIDALARLTARILDQTEAFERDGSARTMVQLRAGHPTGNWRDSNIGIGGGRAPLDVNAYLVPASLRALSRALGRAGFPRAAFLRAVERHRRGAARSLGTRALEARARAWDAATESFGVRVSPGDARQRLASYMAGLPEDARRALGASRLWSGVTIAEAIAGAPAPELDRGVAFPGVALDERGDAVPVMSSDEAFGIFYGEPSRDVLLDVVRRVFQPFPVGLATPVGIVAANPAYSSRAGDAETFGPDKYHGSVIWSWPQTMLRRGLERQLARFAGDADATHLLQRAIDVLDRADAHVGNMRASELWTWTARNGAIHAEAFGHSASHSDESNAVQLWSNTR